MNLDFHYYATHLAARQAGFSQEEAMIIAKAAELVDDATMDNLSKKIPQEKQVYTCMSMMELIGYFMQWVDWTDQQMQKFRSIWMAFHFAPGNLDHQITYQGADTCAHPAWKLSEEDLRDFSYLCLPGSEYIGKLVNDLRRWRGSPQFLHMVGIRMHTLADSWAHQRFLGVPRMSADELVESYGVQILKNGTWQKASFNLTKDWKLKDDLDRLIFITPPPGDFPSNASWTNIAYLGHGRIGSIADYGCLTFRYMPFFQSKAPSPVVERANPEIFSDAFDQMVQAMVCVRQDVSFDPQEFPQKRDHEIIEVLQTETLDQSSAWNALIQKRYGYSVPSCNINEWIDQAKKGDPNYQFFAQGAKEQINLFWETFPELR